MVKTIKLRCGKRCTLDERFHSRVADLDWRLLTDHDTTRVVSGVGKSKVFMHTFIANWEGRVYYRDGKPTNLKRKNLLHPRIYSHLKKYKPNGALPKTTSVFPCVSWNTHSSMWAAEVRRNYLGTFDTAEEAWEAVQEFSPSHLKKYKPYCEKRGNNNFKGVSWSKREKKWIARHCSKGIRFRVGGFPTELQAVHALTEYTR